MFPNSSSFVILLSGNWATNTFVFFFFALSMFTNLPLITESKMEVFDRSELIKMFIWLCIKVCDEPVIRMSQQHRLANYMYPTTSVKLTLLWSCCS